MSKVVLLDAGIPIRLAGYFDDSFSVVSVHDLGWSELKNGNLLQAMKDNAYQFLVSNDRRMQEQQNHRRIIEANVTIISFKSYRLTIERLKHGVPKAIEIINRSSKPGFYVIDINKIIDQL